MAIMENKDKIILDLCGGTGAWSKDYVLAGYDVRLITLPEYNVLNYKLDENIYGILAAPVCTHFSRVRSITAKVSRNMKLGMETVRACLEIIWKAQYNFEHKLKFWCLENPDGYLKRMIGPAVFKFDPCDFGDPYTKRTCLWGNFNIPKKKPVKPIEFKRSVAGKKDFVSRTKDFSHLKQIPEGYQKKTGFEKRAILRSMTPRGFAKAFYEVNQ